MGLAGLKMVVVGPLPPPAGGMANQTRQLVELLRAEGIDVHLVQVNAPYRPALLARLRGARAVFRLLPYLGTLWSAIGRAQLVHVMANSGWSWHLFAVPAIWLARLRGVPALVNYRGGEAGPFLAKAARWVRFSVARSSGLLFPSSFLEEVFAAHGMSGVVVPNIIDLDRFRPRDGAAQPRRHIVVARNLEALYGIDTALRAFALVRRRHVDARLSVAGSGPQESELRALSKKLGLGDAVCFTGRLDREQMAALYRDADLMLNPTRVDNMPNSILEAQASGIPVVSTNVGGIPYIVEHGRSALLVEPDAPEAMAQACLELLDDESLCDRLVRAALEDVRRYSWPRVREKLFAAYRDALGVKAPRLDC